MTLIADSPAVSLGAVGTPVTVSLAQSIVGLCEQTLLANFVQARGLDILVASFLPLLMGVILTRLYGANRSFRAGGHSLFFAGCHLPCRFG